MKRLMLITVLFVSISNYLFAQWTPSGNDIYNSNTGNVGIGTSTPKAILDMGKPLNPGQVSTILARLSEGYSAGGGTYLGTVGYNTQPSGTITDVTDVKSFAIEHSFYGSTNSSINFLRGGGTTGGSISFNTNDNTEKMRILYNGNVGIGIAHPKNKLDVNGTVHARQVQIDLNGWADYVFKPTYQLPALSDVKSYIDHNQHLPDIPSEQEILKDGLNVGEMNKLLMKKVEELTLYLIENERKDKEKDKLLTGMQKRITELENNTSKQKRRQK
ncbi:hypothetical protein [Mucilaginibacter sp. 3215]|uniref:hypothetical protein n=1 Tax=Mucilaginibacter sp. 3215 TaxID=3373912 RepID=UPI003D1CE972